VEEPQKEPVADVKPAKKVSLSSDAESVIDQVVESSYDTPKEKVEKKEEKKEQPEKEEKKEQPEKEEKKELPVQTLATVEAAPEPVTPKKTE